MVDLRILAKCLFCLKWLDLRSTSKANCEKMILLNDLKQTWSDNFAKFLYVQDAMDLSSHHWHFIHLSRLRCFLARGSWGIRPGRLLIKIMVFTNVDKLMIDLYERGRCIFMAPFPKEVPISCESPLLKAIKKSG